MDRSQTRLQPIASSSIFPRRVGGARWPPWDFNDKKVRKQTYGKGVGGARWPPWDFNIGDLPIPYIACIVGGARWPPWDFNACSRRSTLRAKRSAAPDGRRGTSTARAIPTGCASLGVGDS